MVKGVCKMSPRKLYGKVLEMGHDSRKLATALVITAASAAILPGTAGAQGLGYKWTDSLTDPGKDAIVLLAEGYRPAQFLNYLDECRADILGGPGDRETKALAIDECMDNKALKGDVKAAMPYAGGAGLVVAFGLIAANRRRNKPKPMATRVKNPQRRNARLSI